MRYPTMRYPVRYPVRVVPCSGSFWSPSPVVQPTTADGKSALLLHYGPRSPSRSPEPRASVHSSFALAIELISAYSPLLPPHSPPLPTSPLLSPPLPTLRADTSVILLNGLIILLSAQVVLPSSLSQRLRAQAPAHTTLSLAVQALPWVTSLIPLNGVTILLPLHAHTIRFFMAAFSSQKQQQLIAYHILQGRYDFRRLRYQPRGRRLRTLEGTSLVKRGRKGGLLVAVKGKGGAPVPIVMPNLFNGSQFTIHAVSEMVVPHDIY
ncbi:unnamed protein product [Closterium sp. Naga37s-1]|nr:unnamed protein product [Closterium sp. Naga37s-1]